MSVHCSRAIIDTVDPQARRMRLTVLPSVYRDALGDHWETPELLGMCWLASIVCETSVICSNVDDMTGGRQGAV